MDLEKDKQEGGSHYDNKPVQPIDLIRACKLDFEEGSVIKYVARYKEKNGLRDLIKARQYLGWLIDRYDHEDIPDEAFPKSMWADSMAELCDRVAKSKLKSERIVVIPRGGLTLGHALAERLDLKDVELYDPTCIYEGNVLLVDDICDSGETLENILNRKDRFRGGVKTVVLAQRYSSLFKADFVGSVIKHDDYVVFPWENIDEQK